MIWNVVYFQFGYVAESLYSEIFGVFLRCLTVVVASENAFQPGVRCGYVKPADPAEKIGECGNRRHFRSESDSLIPVDVAEIFVVEHRRIGRRYMTGVHSGFTGACHVFYDQTAMGYPDLECSCYMEIHSEHAVVRIFAHLVFSYLKLACFAWVM